MAEAQKSQEHSSIPGFTTPLAQTGKSTTNDALGMREMQARAYRARAAQYLLIKSPPASGKSRALMFIALDKLRVQGLKQVLVLVPEKSIGSSFHSEPLSKFGFPWDWTPKAHNNLCNHPGTEGSKVKSLEVFLNSSDDILICTHATFRFAYEALGPEAFDHRLLAVDEFHHVSASEDNILGTQLQALMARDKVHLVAMTGSYFRGDAVPVLLPEDEDRFEKVTYTYYEQLNGYTYLKSLKLGYVFYQGLYSDAFLIEVDGQKKLNTELLNPKEKTILHIPNVNSRESTSNKYEEVSTIIDALGTFEGRDEETGFLHIRSHDTGKIIRVADLVDDDPQRRNQVQTALKSPLMKKDRDYVDLIIALGTAKEGFDWIWCEHALTVGYRSSLTEIVQIIGRTTRDAPYKTEARFTNLIAEPEAEKTSVQDAVNDTIKAIAASLLMEQVLVPNFDFRPKPRDPHPDDPYALGPYAVRSPDKAYDYGPGGYQPDRCNLGYNPETLEVQVEIEGLIEPKSEAAKKVEWPAKNGLLH